MRTSMDRASGWIKETDDMEQQDRIMDGDLQTLGLQAILKMLALSRKTGTLFVHSGQETLSISLRKGQIVALREDGVPQPDLPGMLCLVNRLDPARVQPIREYARGNMQVALALLQEQGLMGAAEVQQRLEFAVTQSISHALRWINGRFAFHPSCSPWKATCDRSISTRHCWKPCARPMNGRKWAKPTSPERPSPAGYQK